MAVDSLRTALPKPGEVRVVSNASLFFDKWLERQETGTGGSSAKDELLNKLVGTSPSEVYGKAFERWKSLIESQPNTASAVMRVKGSLIVGLGGENVLEAGLTLHRTYGMPIIPGSALKGLSRHYAQQVLGLLQGCRELSAGNGYQGAYHEILFGNTESAGCVNYLDAWYVPGSAPGDKPFVRDVITTHHPKYYQEQSRWPWDFDDPNPVPFISVRGSFLVAVSGPSKEWAEFALKLLQQALEDYGVGGKTSSGYGRLRVEEKAPAAPKPGVAPGGPATAGPGEHPLVRQIKAVTPANVKGQVPNFYQKWQALQTREEKVQVAEAIIARLEEVGALKQWQERPWVKELLGFLGRE